MVQVIKTTLKLGAVAAVGAALALGWRDIKRFVQIKRLSATGTHPERIPVGGRAVYPRSHADGERTAPATSTRRSGAGPTCASRPRPPGAPRAPRWQDPCRAAGPDTGDGVAGPRSSTR